MSLSSEHVVKCAKCSKTLSVSGANATRKQLWTKARAAGWSWPNATTQLCPDHKTVAAPAKKVAKKAKGKASKKAAKTGKPRRVATLPGVPDIANDAE